MFYHAGKYYMSYGLHTSRHPSGTFIEPARTQDGKGFTHKTFAEARAEGGMPMGATLSVSEDGIHFRRTELLYHGSQNPSVYSTKEGELILYGGYGGEGVYRTNSIAQPFVRSETDMVFSGPTTALHCTSECPAFFEMNGYQYLIVGFRGYFRTLNKGDTQMVDAIKLGENIYDGLCVPMVAELENGRRIIAGWIRSDLGWGAALVQRELIGEPDGRLGMRWIPELYPTKADAPQSPKKDGSLTLCKKKSYLLEAEVEADESGIFALDLLGEDGAATQLRRFFLPHTVQQKPPSQNESGFFLLCSLFSREIFLADAAQLAGEILGQIFPLHTGFLFIVNPAADIAHIFHNHISL
jgi:hypothetical protein